MNWEPERALLLRAFEGVASSEICEYSGRSIAN
jgi:hypothetical protein